jgi:hypothetical protein
LWLGKNANGVHFCVEDEFIKKINNI